MTHVTELAIAAALVGALGLGALAALPVSKPAAVAVIPLQRTAAPVDRAEPATEKSNPERVEALQRRVADIAAGQRELAARVRALAQERDGR